MERSANAAGDPPNVARRCKRAALGAVVSLRATRDNPVWRGRDPSGRRNARPPGPDGTARAPAEDLTPSPICNDPQGASGRGSQSGAGHRQAVSADRGDMLLRRGAMLRRRPDRKERAIPDGLAQRVARHIWPTDPRQAKTTPCRPVPGGGRCGTLAEPRQGGRSPAGSTAHTPDAPRCAGGIGWHCRPSRPARPGAVSREQPSMALSWPAAPRSRRWHRPFPA